MAPDYDPGHLKQHRTLLQAQALEGGAVPGVPPAKAADGRKPTGTEAKLQQTREHIAKGLTVREAAMRVEVSKTALYEALRTEPT